MSEGFEYTGVRPEVKAMIEGVAEKENIPQYEAVGRAMRLYIDRELDPELSVSEEIGRLVIEL